MPNELKPNLIKNWNIGRVCEGLNRRVVIVGEIFNDTKGRFEDGSFIQTSYVKYVDFEKKVAHTRNSIYNLE